MSYIEHKYKLVPARDMTADEYRAAVTKGLHAQGMLAPLTAKEALYYQNFGYSVAQAIEVCWPV